MKLVYWATAFGVVLFAQHSAQAACAMTSHVEWTGPMGGHWTVERCLKAGGGKHLTKTATGVPTKSPVPPQLRRKPIHAPQPQKNSEQGLSEARYSGEIVRDLSPPPSLFAPAGGVRGYRDTLNPFREYAPATNAAEEYAPCERELAEHFGSLTQDMRWFCERYNH